MAGAQRRHRCLASAYLSAVASVLFVWIVSANPYELPPQADACAAGSHALLEHGDIDRGYSLLSACAASDVRQLSAVLNLARIDVTRGHVDLAVNRLRAALNAAHAWGDANASAMVSAALAHAHLSSPSTRADAAAALSLVDLSAVTSQDALLAVAHAWQDARDFGRARAVFAELLARYPGAADGWLGLGYSCYFAGDVVAALAAYQTLQQPAFLGTRQQCTGAVSVASLMASTPGAFAAVA